jgi:hypothetical protein
MSLKAEKISKESNTRKGKSVSETQITNLSQSTNFPNDQILYLQKTIGNQAVQRIFQSSVIQMKQEISQIGESHENGEQMVNSKSSEDSLSEKRIVSRAPFPILLQSPLMIQLDLRNRQQVRSEITRMTGTTTIPSSVVRTLLVRLELRRRILSLQRRRTQLRERYIRCFPNGDCGFVGITQSDFTTRDSRLIDQIISLRRRIYRGHRDPVTLANIRLAVVDPLGMDPALDDALRIAETTYTFDEPSVFRTETRWRRVREFPSLPQVRPSQRLAYLFVAVTRPADIQANNIAAAETARNAVRSNRSIYDPNVDHSEVVRVSSIDSFIRLLVGRNTVYRRQNMRVRQIEVFSHGGLDGPMFGDRRLQFDFTGATTHGARPLSALPRLPYTGDAIVFFRGCRIGAGRFLQAFARQQGVATYGFVGTTSFSTRPRSFYAWRQGLPAYQLDFPGSETWSQISGQHPSAVPPRGYVPEREVVVQRKMKTPIYFPSHIRPFMQRLAKGEEERVLREKDVLSLIPEVLSGLDTRISSIRGGGQPLSDSDRSFFEPRFGRDFSQVRVHSDGRASELARSVNARAFAIGQDMIFGEGQYAPGTSTGRRLMAHELTHVVQQGAVTSPLIQRVVDWRMLYQRCRQDVFGTRNRLSWGRRRIPPLNAVNLILQVTAQGAGGYGPEDLATVWAIETNFTVRPQNHQNTDGSVDIGPVQINYQLHSPGKSARRRNAIFGTNLRAGEVFNGNPVQNLHYGWLYLRRHGHRGYNPRSRRRAAAVSALLPELRQFFGCLLRGRTVTFTEAEAGTIPVP